GRARTSARSSRRGARASTTSGRPAPSGGPAGTFVAAVLRRRAAAMDLFLTSGEQISSPGVASCRVRLEFATFVTRVPGHGARTRPCPRHGGLHGLLLRLEPARAARSGPAGRDRALGDRAVDRGGGPGA